MLMAVSSMLPILTPKEVHYGTCNILGIFCRLTVGFMEDLIRGTFGSRLFHRTGI